MPLDEPVRSDVCSYILRHIVPKGVSPRPRTAMEWFDERFSFISDLRLRQHLAEACYQARFVGRFQEALRLGGRFNRAILKMQIILYASIYEAVIDHFLEILSAKPAVAGLLVVGDLQEVKGVLGGGSVLTRKDGDKEYEVLTCRRTARLRKLQDVRFGDRLDAAQALGLVPSAQREFIQRLYDARNNIHIKRAAAEDFAPDARMSSRAFRALLAFFTHAETWSLRVANKPQQPTGAPSGAGG